jgi:glutamate synthase domain-containing protein 3
VDRTYRIGNLDRSIATTLSGTIGARFGNAGVQEGSVTLRFTGSAGQSFGAFLAPGVRLLLEGESNDYVGKGMAGGEIVVRPSPQARYAWHKSSIIGNTCLYGATSGELFAAGRAGERFAVRNSGAVTVVEGVGDHACEYMTGGVVLVLGSTGRNFAAGMTGGLAYVFDEEHSFGSRCNSEMVALSQLETQDEQNIRVLLIRHLEVTSSPLAADLLRRWEAVRSQFVRIKPRGTAQFQVPPALTRLHERATAGG